MPEYDSYYWINAHAHPVISAYYPFSAIVSCFVALQNKRLQTHRPGQVLQMGFISLLSLLFIHILFGFFGWYCLVHFWANYYIALFGAITFTLAGYNWKQQPCFQYTVAWFPWLLYGIASNNLLLSAMSMGMVLLAGYYPIGIQITLIAILASLYWKTSLFWVPIGVLIGLPQLIPFLRYLPKTIRANRHDSIGKVPWWHAVSLIFPTPFRYSINAVGYWEMSYYIGIIPLLAIWHTTSMAVCLMAVVAYLLMLGAFSQYFPRIPARWCFTFQFSLIWAAVSGLSSLNLPDGVLAALCLIQAADLWLHNSPLLVNHPYAELYNKPSWAFNTRLTRYLAAHLKPGERVSGLPYPLFTGHLNSIQTLGYSGGMQLKLMARWRNDSNSNGSGGHDYFRDNVDGGELDRSRVRYAYTTKRIPWEPTPIKYLWRNPRLFTS